MSTNKIIVIGILAQFILFIFNDKNTVSYAPVLFWAIGLLLGLNFMVNIFKLSSSVKKNKPDLFERYSLGIMIRRNALSDAKFLYALNEDEFKIAENKNLFTYFLICFVLFGVSVLHINF